MRLRWAAVAAVVMATTASPPRSMAITVTPTSFELDLVRERSQVVMVTNTHAEHRVPVKISTLAASGRPDGQEVRESTEDLVVFPAQFLLAPGEQRAIRIGSKLTAAPAVERFYRVIVEELPVVENAADRSGVKLVMNYVIAMYVRPHEPRSDARLIGVERSADGLVLKLRNDGNAHTHLREAVLTLTQDGVQARFADPAQMPGLHNTNVLAHGERHIAWRWPAGTTPTIELSRPFEVHLGFKCDSCDEGHRAWTLAVP